MSVPYQTPEEHLERLLGRALNSFELPDETIRRLDSALAHDSSLRSAHHSGGLHRETYRHTFLLADGEALTLWELRHNAAPNPAYRKGDRFTTETQHELYAEEDEARIAAARIAARSGRGCVECAECPKCGELIGFDGLDGARPTDGLGGFVEGKGKGNGVGNGLGDFGEGAVCCCSGACGEPLPVDRPALKLPPVPAQRAYAAEESADHARRLLRRAENADRPGSDTAVLLRSAAAHQITQCFGRPGRSVANASGTGRLGFALYEHAFLLADGRETSLWEVEHTDTPDGRHMCEVYVSEDAARAAMELRARRAASRTS